ncbi:uncharacterized protein N7482_002285 [Penicillium canariense]|uniref:Rhodopsin domain-containing protein n=1 Tax=Penicillium canariense TaxID=189055 RepID=A0A9W9IEZ2_9EURO|nr:uncharacterized protein N7482_002285 [Penicillium canariense]KAJ5176408.1 hypothetical protein N7482_002285 [Penicillium canariense]
MLAGKGVRAVAVMWVMTFISFILVPLRLYTRIYIVKALGEDDHVFNLAWVSYGSFEHDSRWHDDEKLTGLQLFLLLYTIFITIAGVYGFGQPISNLKMDMAVKAVYNEMIGQTFAVLGMAIAKLSLGIFLLRIVVKQWHRVTIWFSMVSLSVVSVMTAIIFWVQKIPSESIYDPRVPGRLVVTVTPFSILLGSWCAAVDFYFALLPWIFLWKLNMKFKEKITIAISLSLGFMCVVQHPVHFKNELTFSFRACICGIIRTIDLGGLSSANYTEDTVDLIIWSAVELAVTLICVGIPTVRPLYRVLVHGSDLDSSEAGYVKHNESNETSRFRMQNLAKNNTAFTVKDDGNTELYISRNNRSDEEVLVGRNGKNNRGIRVKEEVRVERN